MEFKDDIDHIINNYKNQLNLFKIKKEPNDCYSTNNQLLNEMQNDNLKLQTQLINNKKLIFNLNQKILDLQNEISDLKQLMENKENEYNQKIENTIKKYEEQVYQITISKNEEQKLIDNFFKFFNNNLNVFIKTELITIGDSAKIFYDENNISKNIDNFNFALTTIDTFINKLMKDNTQMYNDLVKLETNQNITESNNQQQYQDIQNENLFLKQQLNDLTDRLKTIENNKLKVKKSNKKINNNNDLVDKKNYDSNPMSQLKKKIEDLENRLKSNDSSELDI